MSTLLVHLVTGPQDPTRCALALLVARTAAESGHTVDVFVAGDGVNLLRPSTIDAAKGVGTGAVGEHLAALRAASAGLWASGQSGAARGLDAEALASVGFTAAPPARLLELSFAADRVLVY